MNKLILSLLLFLQLTVAYANDSDFGEYICNLINEQRGYEETARPEKFPIPQKLLEIRGKKYFKVLKLFRKNIGRCTLSQSYTKGYSKDVYFLAFEKSYLAYKMKVYKTSLGDYDRLEFEPFSYEQAIIPLHSVMLPMRDGMKMETIIVGASKNSVDKKPIILRRTPYLYKNGEIKTGEMMKLQEYVQAGYVVVHQSIRGTGGSEGDFLWLSPQEIEDAHDTINWLADASFSNGNIATFGGSYPGFTALAAGINAPEALKVVLSASAPTDPARHSLSNGYIGTSLLGYLHYHDGPEYQKINYSELYEKNEELYKLYKKYGIADGDMDEMILGTELTGWDSFLKEKGESFGIIDKLHLVNVPTYHIAGSLDDQDSRDTVDNFQAMEKQEHTRSLNHLYIGAWGHAHITNDYFAPRLRKILDHYLLEDNSIELDPMRVHIQSGVDSDRYLSSNAEFPYMYGSPQKLYFTKHAEYNYQPLSKNQNRLQKSHSSSMLLPSPHKETKRFLFKVTEDMVINGVISFDLYLKSNKDLSNFAIAMAHYKTAESNPWDWKKLFGTNYYIPVAIKDANEQVKRMTFATNWQVFKLQAGDQLLFSFTENGDSMRANEPGTEIEILHSLEYPSSISIVKERDFSFLD